MLIRVDTDIIQMGREPVFSLKEAAKRIGVSSITLRRWLLSGRVKEVARDRNGWRVFNEGDITRIRKFAEKLEPPDKK